jgi:uncharacterized membrane protein
MPPQDQSAPQTGQAGPQKNTLMGVLAYLGPLIIISYISAKDDPFVKFHIRQGLVLLVIEVALWVLSMMFWTLAMIFNIVNLAVLVLVVLGIINVVQGKEQNLPLVGQFARLFNF